MRSGPGCSLKRRSRRRLPCCGDRTRSRWTNARERWREESSAPSEGRLRRPLLLGMSRQQDALQRACEGRDVVARTGLEWARYMEADSAVCFGSRRSFAPFLFRAPAGVVGGGGGGRRRVGGLPASSRADPVPPPG